MQSGNALHSLLLLPPNNTIQICVHTFMQYSAKTRNARQIACSSSCLFPLQPRSSCSSTSRQAGPTLLGHGLAVHSVGQVVCRHMQ